MPNFTNILNTVHNMKKNQIMILHKVGLVMAGCGRKTDLPNNLGESFSYRIP
jgi:hypothetical protein